LVASSARSSGDLNSLVSKEAPPWLGSTGKENFSIILYLLYHINSMKLKDVRYLGKKE